MQLRSLALLACVLLATPVVPAASPWGTDGCAGGLDAGETWERAFTLPAPSACDGLVGRWDDVDWYAIEANPTLGLARLHAAVCWDVQSRNRDDAFYVDAWFAPRVTESMGVDWLWTGGHGFGSNADGCEQIDSTVSLPYSALGGAWYLRVNARNFTDTAGVAFYHLSVATS